MNQIIFVFGVFFLLFGLIFFYRPAWLLRINKFCREQILNDQFILLERRKRGIFLLLISFLLFYSGYYRAHYYQIRFFGRLVSTDRMLYQSLQHLHTNEYQAAKVLCDRVLQRDPNNSEAYYQLSAAQFLMNDLDGARKSWAKARGLDSRSSNAEHFKNLILKHRSDLVLDLQ